MTLQEFFERTNRLIKYHGDLELKILLNEPSIGPRATTNIQSVYQGIDWENGYLIIEPGEKLNKNTPVCKKTP